MAGLSGRSEVSTTMVDFLWRVLGRAVMPFLDKPLPPSDTREKNLAEVLRGQCRGFPPLATNGLLPSEAAWVGYMNTLRELVLTLDPREFLRWDPVGLMMFPTRVSFFVREFFYLRRHPGWQRWCRAIQEARTGHPLPYLLYPRSSGTLIRHAYHVARFEDQTSLRAESRSIVFEFGGGYGSMCRVFHNLGFHGIYVLFDLPLFSRLQEYYLNSLGISVVSSLSEGPGVLCVSDFDELRNILARSVLQDGSLFIANESFSEIPIAQRGKFEPLLLPFEAFLISFSHNFREADNREYFRGWKERFGNAEWHESPIRQMPGYSYLIGRRISAHPPQA